MDEWIKQGHWWWLLVVPIATGIFALLGSWLGSKLGKSTEHKQWLRDQQRNAYADLIDSTKAASQWASSAYKIESEQARHDEGRAILASLKSGHLVMLAPSATLNAADDMINSLYEFAEQVSIHAYPTGSPQFTALFEDFGRKQMIFNGRCRTDVRPPK